MSARRLDATARRAKAQQLVAYLSYAVDDVRQISPMSSHLLEITITAIKDDLNLLANDRVELQERDYANDR